MDRPDFICQGPGGKIYFGYYKFSKPGPNSEAQKKAYEEAFPGIPVIELHPAKTDNG